MNIGIYSPNWVGDAVMALKFIGKLRKKYAGDELIVIAKDWVWIQQRKLYCMHLLFILHP